MSLKRTDLAKQLALKIRGDMQRTNSPDRFSTILGLPDRREQRKLDQAAGLVPFAAKLNKELVAQLNELATERQLPMNELLDELLRVGLTQHARSAAEKMPVAKKVPAKKIPAKKIPAKKDAAKKTAGKSPAVKKSAPKAAR